MNIEKLKQYNSYMEDIIKNGKYVARFGLVIGGETKKLKDQKYAVFTEGDVAKDPYVPDILKAMTEFASSRMFHYDAARVWIYVMASFMLDGNLNYTDAIYIAPRGEIFMYPFSRVPAERAKYAKYMEWKRTKSLFSNFGLDPAASDKRIKFLEEQTRSLARNDTLDLLRWDEYFTTLEESMGIKRKRDASCEKEKISKERCCIELMKLKRYRNLVPRDDDEKEELAVEISKQKDSDERNNLLFETACFSYLCKENKITRENNIDIILLFKPLAEAITKLLCVSE